MLIAFFDVYWCVYHYRYLSYITFLPWYLKAFEAFRMLCVAQKNASICRCVHIFMKTHMWSVETLFFPFFECDRCWGPWGARRATAFAMSRKSVVFFEVDVLYTWRSLTFPCTIIHLSALSTTVDRLQLLILSCTDVSSSSASGYTRMSISSQLTLDTQSHPIQFIAWPYILPAKKGRCEIVKHYEVPNCEALWNLLSVSSLCVFCLCFLSGFAFHRTTKKDTFWSKDVDIILLWSGIAGQFF